MTTARPLLVGIDGGTQSTKVLVFDTDGDLLAQAAWPLRPLAMPRKGVAEHPGDDLWDSLQLACRQAMAVLGARVVDIAAVGLCSIRFCRALLRSDGTLAAPVLNWMDERVGLPHPPTKGVGYVTAASAYLTARLTGRVADSVANYAGGWPIDHKTWNWSDDAAKLAAMGLNRDLLCELVCPGEILGEITSAAARATGLPAGIPVIATANDKATEALGNGLLNSDQLLLSLGSYITAMRPARQHRDGESHWSNFACLPHRYLDESLGIRRGMSTISWLRDLIGAPAKNEPGPLTEEIMNQQAAKVPAGSAGLLAVLDWLAPTDAPHRRGALIGFDARHGWAHIYRALLEGIAMTMHRHAEAMASELAQPITELVVAGGGSASEVMMQILADVFQVPTIRGQVTNGAGLGAALCAAVGTRIHPDFEVAVASMVRPGEVFIPSPDQAGIYARLRPIYRELPELIDRPLRQIHQLGL